MLPRSCYWWRSTKPLHSSKRGYPTVTGIDQYLPKEPSASNHHDLPSFLDYASRVKLDRKSTTFVGTHYEYTVQYALERLGISSKRVGGRSDYGIDLIGSWNLPSTPTPLKVLAQCKARAAKATPGEVRELEGAFVGAPVGWRNSGVLALLVSQREATKGVRDAMGRSRWPMGFAMCTGQGRILQMLWNRKAEEAGLLGLSVTLKYAGGDQDDKEVVLMLGGKTLGNKAFK